jgi:uncharacterized protein (DUF433 family)
MQKTGVWTGVCLRDRETHRGSCFEKILIIYFATIFMIAANFKKQQLGSGIYTLPDISKLLNIPIAKVRRYINDYFDEGFGKLFFNETYSWSRGDKFKAVNFYTLIELYTCFHLKDLGISTKNILKSRKAISLDLNTPYPFANANLLSDGNKIWYEFEGSIVNADGSRQTAFVEIIKTFANKVEFNSSNIAERFWPAGKKSSIVVDPHHQFGQPVIDGTNIASQTIFSMYESGEPIEAIGILYDLTIKQVRDAINFYKSVA